MKVFFVGAGPGSPDLLTVRALEVLKQAEICIFAGSLVNPDILELLPAHCERHDSSKLDLPEIITICKDAKRRGKDVVRLHSGDPSIYGAIREQMNELDKIHTEYAVIPGVSSFQAAAAALKAELTAPEISQTIILTRTSGRTPMPEDEELEKLAARRATLCIFLSTHKTDEVARKLVDYYGADCPAAVVYRASWPDEVLVTGTLADIGDKVSAAGLKKSAMIVVGRALSRDVPASKLYDPAFEHGYRNGRKE